MAAALATVLIYVEGLEGISLVRKRLNKLPPHSLAHLAHHELAWRTLERTDWAVAPSTLKNIFQHVSSEEMKLPSKTIERKLFEEGYSHVVAVDEVGMGCLAGPVVVCAVVFEKDFFQYPHMLLDGIRDSKLLLPHQRNYFSQQLKKENIRFEVAYCYPKTIDKINIYQASRRAMRKAISKLGLPQDSSYLLIDGDKQLHGISLQQRAIVKGDRRVFSIACASILAKVFRDTMMTRYAKKFPGYGFEKHKGYSTKLHQAQLIALGPSPIHRHSFSRVGKLV